MLLWKPSRRHQRQREARRAARGKDHRRRRSVRERARARMMLDDLMREPAFPGVDSGEQHAVKAGLSI